MATGASGSPEMAQGAQSLARVGGWAAIVSAALALVYAVGFVIVKDARLYSPALMTGGLLSATALAAVYERIKASASALALLGLLFGFAGAMGAIAHGGYDLANVFHAPAVGDNGLPFPVDPRGLLTFGVSGLGVLALSWSALPNTAIPRGLAWLGVLLGILLMLIYLGRLIVLDPNSPLILAPAGLAGIVVSPIWYAGVGRELLRGTAA